MSRMSELDAELREAGIDPEGVDLEAVEAYRAEQVKHGILMTVVESAKEWQLHKSLAVSGLRDFAHTIQRIA